LWKGLATDFHYLIFLQEVLASWLKVELGTYTHIIGSAHLYEEHLSRVNDFMLKKTTSVISPAIFNTDFINTSQTIKQFVKAEQMARKKSVKSFDTEFSDPYLTHVFRLLTRHLESHKS
jgi:thymidylate synthase